MRYLAFIIIFLIPISAFSANSFPALTGRVVDEANILSTESKNKLTALLKDHEDKTTNQIVVVTVPSLNGQSIEEFGVNLGRHWGIGEKSKNNGALFIIAPKDRELRIEVGYGLEGVLTDAITSQIIQTIVIPKFRNGDIEQGVVDGTNAILMVLDGNTGFISATNKDGVPIDVVFSMETLSKLFAGNFSDDAVFMLCVASIFALIFIPFLAYLAFLIILLPIYLLFAILSIFGFKKPVNYLDKTFPKTLSGMKSSGSSGSSGGYHSSSSSSSSSSFSGGGGSFGGGGSSGKW